MSRDFVWCVFYSPCSGWLLHFSNFCCIVLPSRLLESICGGPSVVLKALPGWTPACFLSNSHPFKYLTVCVDWRRTVAGQPRSEQRRDLVELEHHLWGLEHHLWGLQPRWRTCVCVGMRLALAVCQRWSFDLSKLPLGFREHELLKAGSSRPTSWSTSWSTSWPISWPTSWPTSRPR